MAKKFIVNDDSVLNDRGFRVLTSGIRLGRFAKNPLGLFNHIRPDRWDFKKDGILPIAIWTNPEVEGTTLTATPTFDQNDEFAKMIESKVDGGFLRMTSLGLIPITTSSDPRYLLPGQERETLVESELVEISIVDIGSNPNTLALYSVDAEGKLVELTSESEVQLIPLIATTQETEETKPITNMKKIAEKLNLASDATEDQIVDAIAKMQGVNVTLKSEVEAIQLSTITGEVEKAIVDRKFTTDKKEHFINLGKVAGIETLKSTIALIPVAGKPTDAIAAEDGKAPETVTLASLIKMGADEIRKFKEQEPANYAKLFKEHYGFDYIPGK